MSRNRDELADLAIQLRVIFPGGPALNPGKRIARLRAEGATAELREGGADLGRKTKSRAITGAVLLGPAGALAGGLIGHRQHKTQPTAIVIRAARGAPAVTAVAARHYTDAWTFVERFNEPPA